MNVSYKWLKSFVDIDTDPKDFSHKMNMTGTEIKGFSDYLKYPLLILISLFCIVVVISMLIKSQYVVDKQYLTSYYGFIKSRFPIQQITEMVLDTDTKKLTIRFNEQFITLNMRFDWREAFIRAILDANPNVDYSFTMAENKPQDENK